jgi:hypothetical protein
VDSIEPTGDESGEAESGEEVAGCLVIASGNGAEVLKPTKDTLDDVA